MTRVIFKRYVIMKSSIVNGKEQVILIKQKFDKDTNKPILGTNNKPVYDGKPIKFIKDTPEWENWKKTNSFIDKTNPILYSLFKEKQDYKKVIESKFNVEKQEWSNIDMVQFDVSLKEPTKNEEDAKELVKRIIMNTYPNIINHFAIVNIGFEETTGLFRSKMQLVKSLDSYLDYIMEHLNAWQMRRQGYDDKIVWTIKFVQVKVSITKGGKYTEFYLKGIKIDDWAKYVYNPIFDFNCAIECFRYEKNEGNLKKHLKVVLSDNVKKQMKREAEKDEQVKSARFIKKCEKNGAPQCLLEQFQHEGMIEELYKKAISKRCNEERAKFENDLDINEKYCATVKMMLFPEKALDEDITVEEFPRICIEFERNCRVWSVSENEFKLIDDFNFDYDKYIDILHFNNHYILLKNPALVEYKSCGTCQKWFKDINKHHCQRCKKCGQIYKFTHSEKECKQHLVYQHGKSLRDRKKHKTLTAKKDIISADFETFENEKGKLQVYAVGYSIDEGEVKTSYGEDALDKFINMLLTREKKTTVMFHNGGRFDLYFVYERLLQRNIRVKKFIHSDGAYKQISFGNVEFFDLCMHLTAPLAKLCVDFGLSKEESKQSFDHKKINSWNDVEEFKNEWEPYLRMDIISMRKIYLLYAQWIWDEFQLNVNKFITLSQMTDANWRTTLTYDIKLLPFYLDCFIRRSIFGGRCYPQKQYFESEGEKDYLMDCDVVSLYPTAMHDFQYPIGEYKFEEKINKERESELLELLNKCGNLNDIGLNYFVCELDAIPNKKLVSAVLARKGKVGTEWSLEDIENQVYNSVDIQEAFNHGYKFTKVHSLISWEKSAFIFRDYIKKLFEIKQKAEKNTVQYEVSKLLMNGLYGKQIQAPIEEKQTIISTMAELYNLRKNNLIIDVKRINDDKYVIDYEPIDKNQLVSHPSQLGSFILGYSRKVMNKFIDAIDGYYDINCSYWRTDTDSLIVHREQYEKFVQLGLIGSNLGQLSLDIKGNIYRFREICPKVYICMFKEFKKEKDEITGKEEYVEHHYATGKIKKHIRAKGMSKKAAQLLEVEHFDYVMFGKDFDKKQLNVLDDFKHNIGSLSFDKNQIVVNNNNILKKNAFNIPQTKVDMGVEVSQIYAETLSRTLGKTVWSKRDKIEGNKHLASWPKGYSHD